MNAFQCAVTDSKHDAPALMKPQVARRCGADPEHGVKHATPSNCTYEAKQPLYWLQKEGDNVRINFFLRDIESMSYLVGCLRTTWVLLFITTFTILKMELRTTHL